MAEWKMPVLACSAFAQDKDDPDLFTIGSSPPSEDFEFDFTAGGENVVMTPSRGWTTETGTKVAEFRPAYWKRYEGRRAKLRVQFCW